MPPKTRAAAPSTLAGLRDRMTKTYGDGRVMRRANVVAYEVIPTGSLSLDAALIVGGWVRGRIHEIVGPEGVGKTTQVIASMIEAQKKGQHDHSKMAMDHSSGVSIAPGQTATFVWTFKRTPDLEFACDIPGHYEDGMKGAITFSR